jgi:hypothetical protein
VILICGKYAVTVRVTKTQSGLLARLNNNGTDWCMLLPEGKVIGTPLVEKWLPYSGFSKKDLDLYFPGVN